MPPPNGSVRFFYAGLKRKTHPRGRGGWWGPVLLEGLRFDDLAGGRFAQYLEDRVAAGACDPQLLAAGMAWHDALEIVHLDAADGQTARQLTEVRLCPPACRRAASPPRPSH